MDWRIYLVFLVCSTDVDFEGLHMPDLDKPGGYKLILMFLEKKGFKKDALDKRLLANRRYEAISRRPGQTLQNFFATENMAYADAVKLVLDLIQTGVRSHLRFRVRPQGGRTRGISGSSKDSRSCTPILRQTLGCGPTP